MTEKYEAVVVGAGPAGLAAAMELSRNGVQTLVLERGKKPGTKNVTGGLLYGQTNTLYNLDYLVPDFAKTAPMERTIDKYEMHAIAGDKAAKIDLTPLHNHQHKWSYSVLRVPFDSWFSDRVHESARRSGGGVLSDIHVTGLLRENGEVVGVESDELDPIRADVVIAADGAGSELVRKAGLRDWMPANRWFQGVKAVVKKSPADIESSFGLSSGQGAAHLFAGDLFEGVRGGGFLYTNKDTLSIGTVFHLDSLAQTRVEPHALLDRLLKHPLVANWIGEDYQELEYSAKLVPDGKKAILAQPGQGRFLAVGDAAGQMMAQGPVIKGMNLGISAGVLAARSFLEAKAANDPRSVGSRYSKALRASYVYKDTRPLRYRLLGKLGEAAWVNRWLENSARHGLVRSRVRAKGGASVAKMFASPFWAGANPDIRFSYVTLPAVFAEEHGKTVDRMAKYDTPTLDERIANLNYDTAIGRPHIQLLDTRPEASGAAVFACPVSSASSTRGCYRFETQKGKDGAEHRVVALDTQPCVECGTCGVVAATKWVHPPGGKGVQYRYG